MNLAYTVQQDDEFNNVRDVLKNHFKVSTRLLLKLKKLEMIFINDASCRLDDRINVGDIVSFSLDYEEDNSNIVPVKMDLDIVYEDDAFLIINKPPFMAIHPTTYHLDDTLSNGVKYYFDNISLKKKLRPINRLDRNTSGLVVFAKNEYVQELLIVQMSNGSFKKKYLGVIEGNLDEISGSISAPISRKDGSIIERKVDANGVSAFTHYKVVKVFPQYSLVEFSLGTGRTHQIRVHMQYIGHPLVGDDLYGNDSTLINRQALHSYFISFIHPITGKLLEIKSELPQDISNLLVE